MDAAVQLLRKAYEMGINYFDTAMVYHKGESEKIFGKAFEPYPRDSYLIADKMSIWLCSDEEDMKARFYNQLKTLKTDYIDFYLVHSLNRNHYKKVKDLHCVEFLQQMKQEGKIKHLGFSFHDTYQVFTQILNDYTWILYRFSSTTLTGTIRAQSSCTVSWKDATCRSWLWSRCAAAIWLPSTASVPNHFWNWSHSARLPAGQSVGWNRCHRLRLCSAV